jgi:hypothetical protein
MVNKKQVYTCGHFVDSLQSFRRRTFFTKEKLHEHWTNKHRDGGAISAVMASMLCQIESTFVCTCVLITIASWRLWWNASV